MEKHSTQRDLKDFEAASTYSMGELRKFSFEAVVVGPDQKMKIMRSGGATNRRLI